MTGYSLLGWVVWKVAGFVLRRKIQQNRTKVIALGAVALVVVGGIVAAGLGSSEDD